jgi:pyridoxine 4-dehydrogenase
MSLETTNQLELSATIDLKDLGTVHRLGFGAMRIVGDGIWGEPPDRSAAVDVVRRAVELGVDFIDAADSYGPNISEEILAEALHPYKDGLKIATKVGFTRTGPNKWVAVLGLSQVSREELEAAGQYFTVSTVQNRYNLTDRSSEDVLRYSEENGIGFIPWAPISAGEPARPGVRWMRRRSAWAPPPHRVPSPGCCAGPPL